MKHLVIGQARSRSKYFANALAYGLGIADIDEPYKQTIDAGQTTNELKARDNFVAKVQYNDLIRLGADPLLLLDLDMYDNVWITYRSNRLSGLASRIVATKVGYTHLDSSTVVPVEPFVITLADHWSSIYAQAGDTLIKQMVINTLDKLAVDYTLLEYNDVPGYVNTHWPHASSKYVLTGYDYSQLVLNPEEALRLVDQFTITLSTRS